MATKKKKKIRKLEKAKTIIKKINNDLIDASFDAIETTVKTGEKWQKLTTKLIKKTEPLTKNQINMFAETAEAIKSQLESGTERLKKLVGFNPAVFEQAKDIVTENPLTKKAEKLSHKIKKEVTGNPLVKKAEKMTAKLKKEITETIEEISEDVQKKTEKKGKKGKGKKAASKKKTPTKKATEKKETVKKTEVKKEMPKKAVIKENTGKDDLKVIKGIGPKIEKILNNAGITTYKELAKLSVTSINKILTDAEIVNIKIYKTSDWKTLAQEAAKGDI